MRKLNSRKLIVLLAITLFAGQSATAAAAPRVAPLPFDQWSDELKERLGESRETVLTRGGAANMPATFARHPELFAAWSGLMSYLVSQGTLPARSRELIVMRTAWLGQAPLTWVTHAGPASEVGITRTEVDQVIVGPSDSRWAPHDRALLAAVDQFFRTGDLDDGTWHRLREKNDDKQIMELMMLVSNYRMVAEMVQTMRIDLGDDFPGLRLREGAR